MKLIGRIVSTVFLVATMLSILLGLQWLGWHGPQWIMMTTAGGETIVSPALTVPGICTAFMSFVGIVFLWSSE